MGSRNRRFKYPIAFSFRRHLYVDSASFLGAFDRAQQGLCPRWRPDAAGGAWRSRNPLANLSLYSRISRLDLGLADLWLGWVALFDRCALAWLVVIVGRVESLEGQRQQSCLEDVSLFQYVPGVLVRIIDG